MILPKNQIKQFAQMKEAFQNAENSSDNEKQKNASEEPVGAEILRKIDAQRQMLQKRKWNDEAGFFAPALPRMQKLFMHRAESALCRRRKCIP